MRQTADPFCAVCARKVDGDLTIRCLAVFDVLKYRRFIWREPFRFPIPICLSCPRPPEAIYSTASRSSWPVCRATPPFASWIHKAMSSPKRSRPGMALAWTFQSSRAERYFAELIPAQSMTPQEVTLRTELFRNGEAQELPVIQPALTLPSTARD